MNYIEAKQFIESTKKYGSVLGLESIKTLLNEMGNPQNNLNIVHIAGTNGKGSTMAFLSSILMTAGY
ncbi:MAG: bifunctional folylpolyglutamate synthase/dihydrofolate synthase, partial [Eubacterium sp.]|nr:bifunctional folylpolyglutamate synthase/dihydrofolate synthase [Eubacterium sp.]